MASQRLQRFSLPMLVIALLAVAVPAQATEDDVATATPRSRSTAVDGQVPLSATDGVPELSDSATRAGAMATYEQVFKPAFATPVQWSGNEDSCTLGAPSANDIAATLRAINYVRGVSGMGLLSEDTSLSGKAQQTALMMHAESDLSHYPDENWACYTAEGAEGAAKSNLALYYPSPSAGTFIAQYMVDYGSNNLPVGHRRWIMDPRQTKVGIGLTKNANALYLINSTTRAPVASSVPDYFPWPVSGFVPGALEPRGRWSISAKNRETDFSEATVTVYRNGARLPVTVHPVINGYGMPTLVWNFNPNFTSGGADVEYEVTISNILVGGQARSHSYSTTLFDPTQRATQSIDFPTPGDATYGQAPFSVQVEASSGLQVQLTSVTQDVCRVNGAGQVVPYGAGTCTLAANQGGDDATAPAEEVRRTFTVNKKLVMVTPTNQLLRPDEGVAPVTYTYEGFANGQTYSTAGASGSPSCSTTAFTGAESGTYPITCRVGSLAATNYWFGVRNGQIVIDGEAPTVDWARTVPSVSLTTSVPLAWTGADDGSGVAAYDVATRSGNFTAKLGPWQTPEGYRNLAATTVTHAGMAQGGTYCFGVQGTDHLGHTSGLATPRCTTVPLDDRSLTPSTGWTRRALNSTYGGSYLATTTKGARLVRTRAQVSQLSLVAIQCKTCGSVAVFAGAKKLATISLYAPSLRTKRVIKLPKITSTNTTVTIKVLSSGKLVAVDGLAIAPE